MVKEWNFLPSTDKTPYMANPQILNLFGEYCPNKIWDKQKQTYEGKSFLDF